MSGKQREAIGRRVARLRGARGWTQQQLAERLAMSRVAVSHLEGGISQPSERTVTLLAGLFQIEPYELVVDTDYPAARIERLPLVTARYTEVDLQLRLMDVDLRWASESPADIRARVIDRWLHQLRVLLSGSLQAEEQAVLQARLVQLMQTS